MLDQHALVAEFVDDVELRVLARIRLTGDRVGQERLQRPGCAERTAAAEVGEVARAHAVEVGRGRTGIVHRLQDAGEVRATRETAHGDRGVVRGHRQTVDEVRVEFETYRARLRLGRLERRIDA